jgi:hypothetical protein
LLVGHPIDVSKGSQHLGGIVSSQSVSAGSKRTVVIVLAVLAVLAIILGIVYFIPGAAPSFMTSGSHVHKGGHNIRGAVCVVVGLVLGAGAWWQNKKA